MDRLPKNLTSIVAANAVTPLAAIATGPILAYSLGPDGRGQYAALTTPIVLLGIVGTFGFQDALTYAVARAGWDGRAAKRAAYRWGVPLSGSAILIALSLSFFLTADDRSLQAPLVILSLTLPAHVYTGLLAGVSVGEGRYSAVNRCKAVSSLSRLLLLAVLAVSGAMTPVVAASAHMLSVGAGLVALLIRTPSDRRIEGKRGEERDSEFGLSRYAFQAAPAVVASLAAMRLDQVIALPLIGPTELGYYAAAVGLAESTMILASAGRTLMMGRSAGTRGSDARQAPLIKLILSLTGTGTAILIVASPWIIPLLLGPQFRPAVVPCIIVASGNLALAGCLLASAKILMQNRAWIQSLAYASGAACNVVGLYMFAHLGAAGAALASGLNYSVALGIMLGLLHIRARRCRRLREQEVMT